MIYIDVNEVYQRKCSFCDNVMIYKHRRSVWKANKKQSRCPQCNKDHMSKKLKGRIFTKEWKEKMSKNHWNVKGKNNPFYKKSHSKKTKDQISNSRTGKACGESNSSKRLDVREKLSKNSAFNDLKRRHLIIEKCIKTKIKNGTLNVHTEESRKKLREKRLEQMKRSGIFPSYNIKACEYFSKLNENIRHALNGGEFSYIGYSADGYDPKTNTWYEWDEERHYRNKFSIQKDKQRMNQIIDNLKCNFIRIRQKDMTVKEYCYE